MPVPRTAAEAAAGPVSYQLTIVVARPVRIAVGALGTFDFPAGRYVYTGSAKRALEARIRRHLGGRGRLHWHVDYLLDAPGVHVERVRRSHQPECLLNARTRGAVVVDGFGASDCRSGCGSHLKRVAGPAPAAGG